MAARKQEEIDEVGVLPAVRTNPSMPDASQLSADEARYYDYATALSEWLTPYHDYARPPPSAVLAEAAKLTEQKTGQSLKGLELPPDAGTNGHAKKDEEPPAVVEPPAAISQHFDGKTQPKLCWSYLLNCCVTDLLQRSKDLLAAKALPFELLHVVTLAQEVCG